MAGTGTKRIIELTEASTIQSGDFIAVDSNARGTKKVPTDTLATSAALTAETNARTGADEQVSERMDGIEEQTALIQNPTKTLSGALCSFTDGAEMPMVACTAEIVPKQSGTGTPSPSNVRPISGWESVSVTVSPTQDAQDGTTTTVNLGRTVYGGTLDVVSGVLTDKMGTITDNDFTNYVNGSSSGGLHWAEATVGVTANADAISSMLEWKATGAGWGSTTECFSAESGKIRVYTSATSLADFKTSFANLTVCYELSTPQTYTLTPTEVKTLLGENNVWADSGDVEVTYRRDISIVINNLESALNG